MASQSVTPTPAAWYPDPCVRHEFRYWDGEAWTDHVSDHGQTAVDPVAGSANGQAVGTGDNPEQETVLKSVFVTDGRIASAWSMHLTNRRLVVAPITNVTFHQGVGGLVGGATGQHRFEKEAEESFRQQPPVDASTLDAILRSEHRAYAINYADISHVDLSGKWPAHGRSRYGRCKITAEGRRNVTLQFHTEMFDDLSAVLTDRLAGKVTIK
jgi:hypothetical protein